MTTDISDVPPDHGGHGTGSTEDIASRVQDHVSTNRLDDALRDLQAAAKSLAPAMEDDVALLANRLTVLDEQERRGTFTREQVSAERRQLADAILKTARQFQTPRESQEPLRPLELAELKVRGRFLSDRAKHLENLHKEALHGATLLHLGILDAPEAVNPGIYRNPNVKQTFNNVGEAFEVYRQRILLLGTPGSGKSIALGHLALKMILKAERDQAAPIPLVVNLSKFRFEVASANRLGKLVPGERHRPEQSAQKRRFEEWLVEELEGQIVPKAIARQWVQEGRIAAFLDGLDEVNDERRVELATLLNDTYLSDHADSVVVVCSRVDEYNPLQQRKDARLRLRGAVVIQPASQSEIEKYLKSADALGLLQALGQDGALYELAQTPLTLSMMSLAHEGKSADSILSSQGTSDQRHQLMQAFVSRMLQRQERRERGIPFDEAQQNEIPQKDYRYHPQRVDHYLSWLAIRLSVRMQTACALTKFHSFLMHGKSIGADKACDLPISSARAVVAAVLLAVMALPFLPLNGGDITPAAAILFSCCVLYLILATLESFLSTGRLQIIVALLMLALTPAWLGLVSHGLSRLFLQGVAPVDIGLTTLAVLTATALAFSALVGDTTDRELLIIPALTAVAAALGAATAYLQWLPWSQARTITICVVVAQTAGFVMLLGQKESAMEKMKILGVVLLVLTSILLLEAGGVRFFDGRSWIVAWALASVTLISLLVVVPEPTWVMAGLAVFFTVGATLAGQDGAVIGSLAFGVGVLLVIVAIDDSQRARALRRDLRLRCERFVTSVEELADRWALSPLALLSLATSRHLPLRLRPFLSYGGSALILKPFAGEVEFVHRRVRDYFALRELIPQLNNPDSRQRLNVIRGLGFQGVAAIDTLGEFAISGTVEEKAIAVGALGRISSPEVTPYLEKALADAAPSVRSAAVRSLRNVDVKDLDRLLQTAADDPVTEVRKAVLDTGADSGGKAVAEQLFRHLLEGSDAQEILLHAAARGGYDSWLSGRNLPASAHQYLPALLVDPRATVRARGCMLIGQLRRKDDFDAVVRLLEQDRESTVREAAARALGYLGNALAGGSLLAALVDKHVEVRAAAAGALGLIRAPQAVDPLILALRDKAQSVRVGAAMALGWLEDTRAVDPLLAVLRDKVGGIRGIAAGSLGRLKDVRAVDPLILALEDSEPNVRAEAAKALGELADPRAHQALTRAMDDRAESVMAAALLARSRLPGALPLEPATLLTDKSAAKRKFAVGHISVSRDKVERTLLSRDVDGLPPWIDPFEIDPQRVTICAVRLGLSEDEVRARYRAFADEFHLRLNW